MSKFYYFGFGSNMLAKRIHIQNPTAVRIGPGKLEGYRLDFHTGSKTWRGAPATIVPTPGASVCGAIWEIEQCNLNDLDKQEGVAEGIYKVITVPVLSMSNGEHIQCRAYHLTNQPVEHLNHQVNHSDVPYDRQPSCTYLKTLIKGAIETGLDKNYINFLRSFKHNGQIVHEMEKRLELNAIELDNF